jgi:hypothetical protein
MEFQVNVWANVKLFFLHDGIRLLMEKWPQIGVTVKKR